MSDGRSEEELKRERYDRQVRLWGSAAQQALQSATVAFVGLRGPAEEVAKNLALVGVGRIDSFDGTTVAADDTCSSHLILPDAVGMARAVAAAPRLQELNAFVSQSAFSAAPATSEAIQDVFQNHSVVIVTNEPITVAMRWAEEAAAVKEIQQSNGADGDSTSIFCVMNSLGPVTLCLAVPYNGNSKESVSRQVTRLVSDPKILRTKPKTYQLAVLMLKATDVTTSAVTDPSTPFPMRVAILRDLAASLGLMEIQDAEIQLVLDVLLNQRGQGTECDVVSASAIGGIVSQQLVAAISHAAGEEAGAKQPKAYAWMAFSTVGGALDCLVGDSSI